MLSTDTGEIIVKGYDVKKDYESAIRHIGGIVENPEFYGFMSGIDNLKLFAKLREIPLDAIGPVVEQVGLANRIHEKVKTYSLGMRQRLGIAQAILHHPDLLILDEPTNGMDPAGIRELRDLLRKMSHEQNMAILVSSHLLAEMELMCDRVGIIDNGVMKDIRPMRELTRVLSEGDGSALLYRFGLSSSEKAAALLKPAYSNSLTIADEHTILLKLNEADINNILSLLIRESIQIRSLHIIERTLEDSFIEITKGGGQID